MSRGLIREPLIILLIAANCLAVQKSSKTESLDDGSVLKVALSNVHTSDAFIQQINIAPSSNVTFNVTNVSSDASFIIAQVHAYEYNVTLSYDRDHLHKVSNRSVFGSNIGLFVKPGLQITTQLFLKNDNVHHVDALLVVIPYTANAPIPGGCNMEFNTEIAPYAMVSVRDAMVIVDVQPSSVPLNGSSTCEKNPVQHDMYQLYLTSQEFDIDSYFTAIINMLTVDDILQNGRQVSNADLFTRMRRFFSAYTGTGSVYVTVASYGGYSAAYVPTFSYACNPLVDPESCEVLSEIFPKLVCAGCFFLGVLAVFQGNVFYPGDMAMPILFTSTVISYAVVVGISQEPKSSANIAIALGLGLIFTLLWGACYKGLQVVAIALFSLTLGFFISCVVYFQSPDSFTVLESDWIFWTLFIAIGTVSSFAIALLSIVTPAITCAIFSSYMMVLPIDYYAGSSLKYIIINVVRRATVSGFNQAVIHPPTQTKDVCLIVLWVLLALYRFLKQWVPGITIVPSMRLVTETTPLIASRFIGRVIVRK